MPKELFTPTTNAGEKSPSNSFDNLFDVESYGNDGSKLTYWISEKTETDDFKPQITIDFKEAVLLEAFHLFPAYSSNGNLRNFLGFPNKVIVKTSLDNGPLVDNTIFVGTPTTSDWNMIQYALTNPVNCTKLVIKMQEVSLLSGEKRLQFGGLLLFRSFDGIKYGQTSGNYADSFYMETHTVSTDNFTAVSNGDNTEHPLSNAFNSDLSSKWVSSSSDAVIDVEFNEKITIEAIIFPSSSHTESNNKIYDGFPRRLRILTSLNGDSFETNGVFHGLPTNPNERYQFVLPKAVDCKKMKIEFIDVTKEGQVSNNERRASLTRIEIIQSQGYKYLPFEPLRNEYKDENYFNSHKIPTKNLTYISNGDANGHPISYAFDDDDNKNYWLSSFENTGTEHARVSVNFSSPVLLKAIIYSAGYSTDSNKKKNMIGFPNILRVFSALNDQDELQTSAIFAGQTVLNEAKYQFVFPNAIGCRRIELEYIDVTPEIKD